ncbi:MAG: hypothetical protein K2F90_00480 [Clostridiales bacterium]|nr:hypothetical protein [Clostridiales bacterium]
MDRKDIVVCFPHIGNYAYAFRYLMENGFGVSYLIPPPITKKTLEIGSKYSPDYVCAPFKYCLGTYIEALALGANCLAQIYGECRLEYYGELQEQLLRDMGYEFEFFNMAEIKWNSPKSIIKNMKIVNPDVSLAKVVAAAPTTIKIIEALDKFEDYIRRNVGFEVNGGEFDRTYNEFLAQLAKTNDGKAVKKLIKDCWGALNAIKVDKPEHTIKVGFVGDYFTVQEPFSNHFMEKELAKFGMEVYRQMNFSCTIIHNQNKRKRDYAKDYVKFDIGATANSTIAEAIEFARSGCDGVIQVKSFGCMPENDAMPILQRVSEDLNVPILHFSFDSQTSETGVRTRLEAFYDMIEVRKSSERRKAV